MILILIRTFWDLVLIGYWEICFVSNSSIGIVHDQERTMSGIITKETNKVSLDKNMVYSWRGPPWTIIRSSVEVVYRLQWSRPWTLSMDDDEKWTIQSSIQRTDEHAILGKIRHVGAVDKPITVAPNSSSSWSPLAVSSRWGSYLRTHWLPWTLGKLLRR